MAGPCCQVFYGLWAEQFFICNLVAVVKGDHAAVSVSVLFQEMPHDGIVLVRIDFNAVYAF